MLCGARDCQPGTCAHAVGPGRGGPSSQGAPLLCEGPEGGRAPGPGTASFMAATLCLYGLMLEIRRGRQEGATPQPRGCVPQTCRAPAGAVIERRGSVPSSVMRAGPVPQVPGFVLPSSRHFCEGTAGTPDCCCPEPRPFVTVRSLGPPCPICSSWPLGPWPSLPRAPVCALGPSTPDPVR